MSARGILQELQFPDIPLENYEEEEESLNNPRRYLQDM